MARDPHWFVYAWGAYGFYHMKKWMWPWAGVYVLQIAFSMVVWQLSDDRGAGLIQGLVALGLFSALAVVFAPSANGIQSADLTIKHPLLFDDLFGKVGYPLSSIDIKSPQSCTGL